MTRFSERQKYGQPCNVNYDQCQKRSKCIDGICKCPLGMKFSSSTDQCEDEITALPNFATSSTSRILSYTAPPEKQIQYGAKYNEINQVPSGVNVRVPIPTLNPVLNIPGKRVNLGGRCTVGFDLCPENAHCFLGLCVCRPGFLYRPIDESSPQIPQTPIQLSQLPSIQIHNPFISKPVIQNPQNIQSPPTIQNPTAQNNLQISRPHPAPAPQVIPTYPSPPLATPQVYDHFATQSPQPLPYIPTFAARPIVRHTIGESCQDHEDCLNGAVCISGICNCPVSTVERDGRCLKVAFAHGAAMPGESCENGELCSGGSLCDSGMKKCICAAGHDGTRGTCIRDGSYSALPGESCAHDATDCTGGSTCVNSICTCDHDHHVVDGYCRPLSAPNANVEFLPSTGLRFSSNPTKPNQRALQCDLSKCKLPTCFCTPDGRGIPGGLRKEETPQFVVLTFDDAVNGKTAPDYKHIFGQEKYRNPNGCPIKGTFFISHEWTNYDEVQWIAKTGHELASNSISHNNLQGASEIQWLNEMDGMRRILAKFGNAREEEIVGLRAPQLASGGDVQFDMMQRAGFLYDNTISANPGNKEPFWPQTLDYKTSWPCTEGNCPQSSFPGIWEIPMNQFYGTFLPQIKSHKRSSMLRAAVDLNATVDDLLEILNSNFDKSYKNNKAPFVLSLNADFLQLAGQNTGMIALENFLEKLQLKKDVYFVTLKSLVSWIQDPKPLNRMNEFPDIACPLRMSSLSSSNLGTTCERPNKCIFPTPSMSSPEHQFLTCNPCPSMYPWLDNPMGVPFYKVVASRIPSSPNSPIVSKAQGSDYDYNYNAAIYQGKGGDLGLLVRYKNGIFNASPPKIANSILTKNESGENCGTEDPRIALLDDTYYLFYTAYDCTKAMLSVMTSKTPQDPTSWTRGGYVLPGRNWSKSGAALFKTKENGLSQHYLFWGDSSSPVGGIGICVSSDGKVWDDTEKFLIKIRNDVNPFFDSNLVESGPSPIQLKSGDFLFIYNSAQDGYSSSKSGWYLQYNVGYVILDKDDPTKVLQRSNNPILSPVTNWEIGNDGSTNFLTPNVVFLEGMIKDPNGCPKNVSDLIGTDFTENAECFIGVYGGSDSDLGVVRIVASYIDQDTDTGTTTTIATTTSLAAAGNLLPNIAIAICGILSILVHYV
ncbi:hypothetical protein FO519_004518 [Halicephalobus sp. NKZ332]|nr:hypothetical protein FO519_004518 [Halicephalobus sp. NKZ332]